MCVVLRTYTHTLLNYDYTSREAGPSGIEVQDCQVSESESQPILSGELSEPCCEYENRPIAFEHSLLKFTLTQGGGWLATQSTPSGLAAVVSHAWENNPADSGISTVLTRASNTGQPSASASSSWSPKYT